VAISNAIRGAALSARLWSALTLALAPAAAQQPCVIELYHGSTATQVGCLPLTKPPFVNLFDLARGLRMRIAEQDGVVSLTRNHRALRFDPSSQTAVFRQKARPFAMRRQDDAIFVRVDAAALLLSEFLGVRVIYEPTSKSIHAPEPQDLRVSIRLRRVGELYRLTLIYSQPIEAPRIEQVGRKLLVKIPASPIVWEGADLPSNEAVVKLDLYEDLPDGTTEALFSIGDRVARYEAEPFTPQNPRTVIKFFGAFATVGTDLLEPAQSAKPGIRRIALDPGHGGQDRGAVGPTGLEEKDIMLTLSKKLARMLRAEGYEVKLTRERDTLLSLKTRTALANNFKADLFVSIHANAIAADNATGSETYYLSPESDGSFDNTHYESYDFDEDGAEESLAMDDDLSLMLWDMAQTKHIEDSFRFAKYIQEELNQLAGTRNRGVKQAPLKVLKGAMMPAVLIETAFISNRSEEQKLKSPLFQENIARSILAAIRNYDADVQKRASQRAPAAMPGEEGRRP